MASPKRTATTSLKLRLHAEPFRFSFVQAVRIIEQTAALENSPKRPVGGNALPDQECIRFEAHLSRSFAPSEVVKIREPGVELASSQVLAGKNPDSSEQTTLDAEVEQTNLPEPQDDPTAPVLTIAFMGLFGSSGVLPHFDTQRLIDAGRKVRTERDFLDLFNHRICSLFYRASTKYRMPFAYEQTYCGNPDPDNVVSTALYALAGMGTPGLRGRLEFADEVSIEFAGLFGQQPPNAISLQRMLASYYGFEIRIEQFVGQWLELSAENRSAMPTPQRPLGQNCQLGRTFVVGDRVWDIASKFRICLGPLSLAQFDSFLPGSRQLRELAQMVRLYSGNQFDFDVQLELLAAEVPETQLGAASQLGLNTWLLSSPPEDNKTDAIFFHSGFPESNSASNAA